VAGPPSRSHPFKSAERAGVVFWKELSGPLSVSGLLNQHCSALSHYEATKLRRRRRFGWPGLDQREAPVRAGLDGARAGVLS
jgi:hypothetical protein